MAKSKGQTYVCAQVGCGKTGLSRQEWNSRWDRCKACAGGIRYRIHRITDDPTYADRRLGQLKRMTAMTEDASGYASDVEVQRVSRVKRKERGR